MVFGAAIETDPARRFRQALDEVAQEETAADPRFKEIYDHYTAFRETYAKWRELGYLKE